MKFLKRLLMLVCIGALLWGGALVSGMFDTQPAAMPFRTDMITRGSIANIITATGSIMPEEEVVVGAQVSGKIEKLHVKRNDVVKAGQLLAEIDPSIPQTQLKQSKASLETAQLAYTLAQRDYERTKTLVSKEYVAKVDLERALQSVVSTKNSLESAKIQVERDEVNLSYTKVTSPIDGVIIAQEVSSGQTLASNFQTPNLFRIAKDLSVMKINMSIPESDISKVRENMPVNFTVDAFPDRTFDGMINAVNLSPNNQSGVVTYDVGVRVENKDRLLFPGMTANISITLSEVTDVLRTPAASLRFTPPKENTNALSRLLGNKRFAMDAGEEDTGQKIYLWQNNRLVPVPVIVGATDDLYVEVKSDRLKENDIVVTGLQVQEE